MISSRNLSGFLTEKDSYFSSSLFLEPTFYFIVICLILVSLLFLFSNFENSFRGFLANISEKKQRGVSNKINRIPKKGAIKYPIINFLAFASNLATVISFFFTHWFNVDKVEYKNWLYLKGDLQFWKAMINPIDDFPEFMSNIISHSGRNYLDFTPKNTQDSAKLTEFIKMWDFRNRYISHFFPSFIQREASDYEARAYSQINSEIKVFPYKLQNSLNWSEFLNGRFNDIADTAQKFLEKEEQEYSAKGNPFLCNFVIPMGENEFNQIMNVKNQLIGRYPKNWLSLSKTINNIIDCDSKYKKFSKRTWDMIFLFSSISYCLSSILVCLGYSIFYL